VASTSSRPGANAGGDAAAGGVRVVADVGEHGHVEGDGGGLGAVAVPFKAHAVVGEGAAAKHGDVAEGGHGGIAGVGEDVVTQRADGGGVAVLAGRARDPFSG
jgi:hypothetical protein